MEKLDKKFIYRLLYGFLNEAYWIYAIPFPDNIPMHDQWIGLLSERVGKVEFCNEQLLLYRRHSNNASEMTHLPLGEMVKNRAIMLKCINKRIREKK